MWNARELGLHLFSWKHDRLAWFATKIYLTKDLASRTKKFLPNIWLAKCVMLASFGSKSIFFAKLSLP